MPVTAKLSQAFYDRLGHPVADEMVEWFNQVDSAYRSELREINELNFARFDAKMEQRFAESDVKLEKRFAESDVKMERRFAEYDVKLEKRFAESDVKMERRFAEYDGRLEKRFAEMRVEMKEQQLTLIRWMVGMWMVQLAAIMGLWIRR